MPQIELLLISTVLSAQIRFPVIGDWGGSDYVIFPTGHTFAQEYGAARFRGFYWITFSYIFNYSMDRECANDACDFLLGVGDNFYQYGVTDVDDTRFRFTYEKVYGKLSERQNLKKLDFLHIQGNHDHRWNEL